MGRKVIIGFYGSFWMFFWYDYFMVAKKKTKKKSAPSFETKILDDFLRAMWSDEFAYAMEYYREKFGLPEHGFHDKSVAVKQFSGKKASDLYTSLTPILRILKLPENFRVPLFNVIVFNGREGIPSRNFDISTSPKFAFKNQAGEILKYSQKISLVTFRALDIEEQELALKELKDSWKKYFPPYLNKRTNLRDKDITKKIFLKLEMEKRGKFVIEEEDPYIKKLRKDYGETHPQYKKAVKGNPRMLAKYGRRTSKDVAKKLSGTPKKSGALRTALSRINKKEKGES